MVTFIPPFMGEEIKSNAEKKMYHILQELEMENAYVLHSLGLPRHQHKLYGEVDFVVVCKRGVACLEIKGGRVECRDGCWIFTDRYGVEQRKNEGPFAQVTGNMFSLLSELRNRFPDNPHIKNILVASGVVFPDIEFTSLSQEMIAEIVFDVRTESVSAYIHSIFDYWEGRRQRKSTGLSLKDIEEIVKFLRADFTFIPLLRDCLTEVERRLVRLTNEQVNLMYALASNDHLLIEGGAGTGKTILALDFAKKRAESGAKVLYLTFNKNLAMSLNRQLDVYVKLKSGQKPQKNQLKIGPLF